MTIYYNLSFFFFDIPKYSKYFQIMIQWKAVKDFKMDGRIFFRYHCASDLAGPACMGFFAWRSFHDRDGRHAQKLRSCVHFQHIQGVTTDLCSTWFR